MTNKYMECFLTAFLKDTNVQVYTTHYIEKSIYT